MYLAEKLTSVWPSLLHLAFWFCKLLYAEVLYGKAPPEVQPLPYTIFERKGTPFVYIILTLNDTLSHT